MSCNKTKKRRNDLLSSFKDITATKRSKTLSKFKKANCSLISKLNNSSFDINITSESSNRRYVVTLLNQGGNLELSCNCGKFFGEKKKRKNCKHISSVFQLLLKNYINSIPENSKNKDMEKLISIFDNINL